MTDSIRYIDVAVSPSRISPSVALARLARAFAALSDTSSLSTRDRDLRSLFRKLRAIGNDVAAQPGEHPHQGTAARTSETVRLWL